MILTAVAPADLPKSAVQRASLEVKYAGALRRIDAADVALLATDRIEPVRMSRSYPGREYYAGFYWARSTGRHHWFESLYEKWALTALDRDPEIISIATQPFRVLWAEPRKAHVPDILVERSDGSKMLIDVRPREQIRAQDDEVSHARAPGAARARSIIESSQTSPGSKS